MADDMTRPFIGYRSAGRRPEAYNDRRASADAPLSALRGYVAGTLGLGGDLEGLLRMITPGVSDETYLPGSEHFRERLPLRALQETPAGRAFQELGGLAGGAGLGTAARVTGKGAQALGRMTAEQVARGVESGSPLFAAAAPAYVIKPKGGNWLAGQSERITGPLKRSISQFENPNLSAEEVSLQNERAAPLNTWIDKKLGNYVRNEMATPEDPLRALAEKWSTEKPQRLAEAEAKLEALNAKTRELAAQRGVPEEWLTQHRQDVLKAEKARDLIEAREALHVPMRVGWEPTELAAKRSQQGFPSKGMGVSPTAKAWEQAADEAIGVGPAGKRFGEHGNWGGQTLEDNPWLAKVPPETPTYTGYGLNELGFEHLTDELRNALNPNSGLPAELLLKYADLPKKTVPDIVNRVADINAWRAAQKAEADLTKANNVAVVPFKEYPDQGLSWKEFKTPEKAAGWQVPDRYSIVKPTPSADTFAIMDKETGKYITSGLESEEKAAQHLHDTLNKDILREALQYEGDTLRHCVGGANYCNAIQSGKSKIFSLRDERGRPHVTIEVKPGRGDPVAERFRDLEPEVVQQIRAIAEARDPSGKPWGPPGEFLPGDVAERHRDLMREVTLERFPEWADLKPADEIAQIKGLDNGPPDAKYLPQVQDFVKSGNWSEVRDLEHSGLVKNPKTNTYDNPNEFQYLNEDTGTWENLADFAKGRWPNRPYDQHNFITGSLITGDRVRPTPAAEGFAAGGYVEYDPAQVDAIMQRTRAGFADGGEVDIASLVQNTPKARNQPTPDELEFLRRFNVTGGGSSDRGVTQLGGRVGYTQPIDEDTLIRMGLIGHYATGPNGRSVGLDRGDIGFERKLDRDSTLKASLGAGRRGVDQANISYNRRFADGGAVNAGNEPLAYDPTKISSIVAQLHEELNNGY